MAEIISLQYHIIEFEEGHRLLALQPRLHAVEREHPVDREMGSDPLQHLDVADLAQPIVIVDHDRVGRPVSEGQETFKRRADRSDVGVDRGIGQHLADLILTGRIADAGGAAAHQHHRLVPRLL